VAETRFDAYLFDAGGIFVLPDPTVLGPLLTYYGGTADAEVHRRAHYAGMAAKSRACADEADWSAYNDAYVAVVGVPEEDAAEAAMVLDRTRSAHLWRHPIADSIAALVELVVRQVPVGVVSNASGQIEAVLRRSGVCHVGDGPHSCVRVIVDSHVVGVAKPDPRIFDPALVHFEEFDRRRLAYVGDSVTMDVAGARAAGLHPILLDPFGDHDGADFDRIASLRELLAWV
jgi:putative hydrolase of the HAD superfamily